MGGHAGTCLGIMAKDGVVLAAEKRSVHKLLDNDVFASEKIYTLDDNIACSVASITSDANVLVTMLQQTAQRYKLNYGKSIPVEQLVFHLCDIKQAYTQFGGMRPFGISVLYMGWDEEYGFQLYMSDPSGNYGGWKGTCIGNNSQAAISMLKQEYKENETTLQQALQLAVKVLSKTLDTNKLTSERVEMCTLTRVDGKTVFTVLTPQAIDKLCAEFEKEKEKLEAEKREKEKASSRK